jgi:hypothetical protein
MLINRAPLSFRRKRHSRSLIAASTAILPVQRPRPCACSVIAECEMNPARCSEPSPTARRPRMPCSYCNYDPSGLRSMQREPAASRSSVRGCRQATPRPRHHNPRHLLHMDHSPGSSALIAWSCRGWLVRLRARGRRIRGSRASIPVLSFSAARCVPSGRGCVRRVLRPRSLDGRHHEDLRRAGDEGDARCVRHTRHRLVSISSVAGDGGACR